MNLQQNMQHLALCNDLKNEILSLQSEIDGYSNPVCINNMLEDMAAYWDDNKIEQVFYPSKQDYIIHCSENWLACKARTENELKKVTAKFNRMMKQQH